MKYSTREIEFIRSRAVDRVESLADAAETMHKELILIESKIEGLEAENAELMAENKKLKGEQ